MDGNGLLIRVDVGTPVVVVETACTVGVVGVVVEEILSRDEKGVDHVRRMIQSPIDGMSLLLIV